MKKILVVFVVSVFLFSSLSLAQKDVFGIQDDVDRTKTDVFGIKKHMPGKKDVFGIKKHVPSKENAFGFKDKINEQAGGLPVFEIFSFLKSAKKKRKEKQKKAAKKRREEQQQFRKKRGPVPKGGAPKGDGDLLKGKVGSKTIEWLSTGRLEWKVKGSETRVLEAKQVNAIFHLKVKDEYGHREFGHGELRVNFGFIEGSFKGKEVYIRIRGGVATGNALGQELDLRLGGRTVSGNVGSSQVHLEVEDGPVNVENLILILLFLG